MNQHTEEVHIPNLSYVRMAATEEVPDSREWVWV